MFAIAIRAFNSIKAVVVSRPLDGDTAASLSMRWARPVFFMLFTIMIVIGWFQPHNLSAYFSAMALAPSWLTDILTILILGLAIEKSVVRPVGTVIKEKGRSEESP